MESPLVNGLESIDLEYDQQVPQVGQRSNVLANKVTSILSSSYADSEIGDVLHIVDTTDPRFIAADRRHLRREVNKEVIDCNAAIIEDFGHVAEVRHGMGGPMSTG